MVVQKMAACVEPFRLCVHLFLRRRCGLFDIVLELGGARAKRMRTMW